MKKMVLAALVVLLCTALALANAQTLRIGLAEEPALLDLTMTRAGRIVFASLCVDISKVAECARSLIGRSSMLWHQKRLYAISAKYGGATPYPDVLIRRQAIRL